MQRGPNIIIHPTRRNGIGSTKSFFGRVMMSVIRIQQSVDRKRHMVPKYSTMLE
jgi:hypothetical protein